MLSSAAGHSGDEMATTVSYGAKEAIRVEGATQGKETFILLP